MWKTIALIVGLAGSGLETVAKSPDTPLEKNAWALLVAGSNGWVNYRHQANICHSYHVMIAEGIPADRIIVMMYDDIANHPDNPTPGVIINHPNGPNVYAGVKIDYKGDDVTPQNFLNVLKGNKAAMKGIGTGRVIESDDTTNVFVHFSDHGDAGVLYFPNYTPLLADDLDKTLKEMNEAHRYNKLIMYIEACYSGSMFENILAEDTRVFVMTSAARDESCTACYFSDFYATNLGDEFSVRWLERMDWEQKGTLDQFFHQYQQLRPAVRNSHIQIYGDFSIGPDAMTPNKELPRAPSNSSKYTPCGDRVSGMTVPLYYYQQKLLSAKDSDSQLKAQKDLYNLVEGRKTIDKLLEELVTLATIDVPHHKAAVANERMPLSLDVFPCYKNLIQHFRSHCVEGKHEYAIHHYFKLTNICILGLDTTRLEREMPSLCEPYKAALKTPVL